MGDQREVACFHLDRSCAHSFGHEALEIRVDRPIFGGDRIETRLRTPRRLRGLAGEQRLIKRLLDSVKYLRLRFRQVAREVTKEGCLGEASFIAVEDDTGGGR